MASRSKTSKSLPFPMLPTDIVVNELLPRLPARSLIRFKCINKFFQTYISSKQFVDLHLNHNLSTNAHSCLVLQDDLRGSLYTLDLHSTHTAVVKLPCHGKSTTLVGCCHGLICFVRVPYSNIEELVFINPCTGMYKRTIIPRKLSGLHISITSSVTFGFGFDSINDDYKVVGYREYFNRIKIDDHDDDDDNNNSVIGEIMVYSLKTDSWRRIREERTLCGVYTSCPNFGVLIKNNLVHWMFECETKNKLRLSCFNLENEQWTTQVPLPEFEYWENLRVINGYLGLFTRDATHRHLWIMKEYGSWVKLISVSHHSPRNCLLDTAVSAYRRETRREELVVKVSPSHQVPGDEEEVYCWYNTKDGTYTNMEQIPRNFNVLTSSIGSLVDVI